VFFASDLKLCLLRIWDQDLGRSLSAVIVGHVVGDVRRSAGSEESVGKEMRGHEHLSAAIEVISKIHLHRREPLPGCNASTRAYDGNNESLKKLSIQNNGC
jgi:hypothetical protein